MTQANDLGAILNQSRANYRGRVNENVQALATMNAGTSTPATTYPLMTWFDTATGKVKMRDAANTTWQVVGDIGPPVVWLSAANLVNVKSYGAVGDGVADDTTSIATAISAMPSAGGRLYFPAGTYMVSSTITLNKPGSYWGDGSASLIKTTSASANVFDVIAQRVSISNLSFSSTPTRTGGAFVRVASNEFRLNNFFMEKAWTGVQAIDGISIVVIDGGYLLNGVATNGVGVLLEGANNIRIRDLIINSSANIGACIRIIKGSNISVDDTNLIHGIYGLDVSPTAGMVVSSLFCNNSFFDNCGTHAAQLSASGSGAAIVRTNFNQCWFSSAGNIGLTMATAFGGVINGTDAVGCHFFLNGNDGVHIADSGVTNTRILGGAAAQNANSGVGVPNNVNDFSIIGLRSGATHGLSGNAWGAFITGSSNSNYTVANCDFRGNTAGSLNDEGTGTKVVAGNL